MTTYLSCHLKGLPFDTRQEIYKRKDNVGVRAMDNAAKIPCRQVLGTYVVEFTRE